MLPRSCFSCATVRPRYSVSTTAFELRNKSVSSATVASLFAMALFPGWYSWMRPLTTKAPAQAHGASYPGRFSTAPQGLTSHTCAGFALPSSHEHGGHQRSTASIRVRDSVRPCKPAQAEASDAGSAGGFGVRGRGGCLRTGGFEAGGLGDAGFEGVDRDAGGFGDAGFAAAAVVGGRPPGRRPGGVGVRRLGLPAL